jgi:hypothetical protein
MLFTERIEKLLASNHLQEVIDEFFKFLNEVPQSNTEAKNDGRQLRGQIIVLSGRFTELNTKINTNTMDSGAANQEKSALINSFIQILNQMPSTYPDLNNYMEEKNEEDEWKDTQKENTIEGYQDYFNKYPNGKYKADTIKLITELEEVKNKQDNEIKRLALLEKERRENDKTLNETKKVSATPLSDQSYQTADARDTAPARARSKKGLIIGLGAAAVVAIIIFFVVGRGSSKEGQQQATVSPIVDSNHSNILVDSNSSNILETNKYYYFENRANKKILAVSLSSDKVDEPLVGTPKGNELTDYEKFNLEPTTGGRYFICTKKNNFVVEDVSDKYSQDTKNSDYYQAYTFALNKDGYFTIESENKKKFMGLGPKPKEGEENDQMIKNTKDSTSYEAQWKLIPTGEKVISKSN